ncbi:phage integrase SAM-like domain-containing protein [Mucilaginibacter galii]|uniref:Transposase n=1 Tax=Mucilaginibacter galii TaxID=2005073 RepID=A0A917N335_9SPHI|nr:phage integrase SAM-like domain-containing protein [Mucilaginibacter galii]GGI52745.1 transposase [Mucilaginibacter galii]
MATVCAKVYEHHKKNDGSYNVKIRIFHKGEKKYLDTPFFLTAKQLTKGFEIKDVFVKKSVQTLIDNYRKEIHGLEDRLQLFSIDELKCFLEEKDEDIDFIKFCDKHIDQLRADKRMATAANHTTVRNSLVDYFKKDVVSIREITSQFLRLYERHLRRPRKVTRLNQFKEEVTVLKEGISDQSLYNYTRDLRTLFNEAKRTYNNDDLGLIRITHYPFTNYTMVKPPVTRKRNLSIEQIKSIRDCNCVPGSRAELARDLFMLSIYMCGMNAVDFYNFLTDGSKERLEYNRSKTAGQRHDNAFISIKVVSEATDLVKKYGGTFKKRYTNYRGLDKALSKGFSILCEQLQLKGVTFYWARHSFANLAYNTCKLSKDHIAQALNHVDNGHKTTDIYIQKDWSIIDEVQRTVLDLLGSPELNFSDNSKHSPVLSNEDLSFLSSLVFSNHLDLDTRKKVMELHAKLTL